MLSIQALRDKRNEAVAGLRALIDGEVDAYDQAQYDTGQANVDKINGMIMSAEKLEAQEAALKEPLPSVGAVAATSIEANEPNPKGNDAWANLQEFVGAVIIHGTRGETDRRLEYDANPIPNPIKGEQRMDTGSSGGFLVPVQFRSEILRVDPAATPLLSMVRDLGAGTPPDSGVTIPALDQDGAAPDHQYGGVAVGWVGEGGAKPSTSAALREVSLTPHEVAAHLPITDKLLRNWPAAGGFFSGLMFEALNGEKENVIYQGNGTAKPLGILDSGNAAQHLHPRATANVITYADIIAMLARRMKRGGSWVWLLSPEALPQILALVNANNNLIFQMDNAVAGISGTLMGIPLVEYEFAPALGSKGDLGLVNVNPYYLLKPGAGPFVSTGFTGTDFTDNKRRIKIFTSLDGAPWLTSKFKLRNGYETSPFVFLDVPSA